MEIESLHPHFIILSCSVLHAPLSLSQHERELAKDVENGNELAMSKKKKKENLKMGILEVGWSG